MEVKESRLGDVSQPDMKEEEEGGTMLGSLPDPLGVRMGDLTFSQSRPHGDPVRSLSHLSTQPSLQAVGPTQL